MTYRRKSSKSYQRNRRPYSNPSVWTEGLTRAVEQAAKLEKDGWVVNVDEGALTPEEAEALTKEAQRRGFDSQAIPVAVDGEPVAQFVAVRRKAGAAPVEETTAATATTGQYDDLTVEETEAQYLRLFYGGEANKDQRNVDNGYILSPDRTLAFARRDATPVASASVLNNARQALQQPVGMLDNESARAIQYARTILKKSTVALGPQGYESYVVTANLEKGIRALAGKGSAIHANLAVPPGNPVAVANPAGDIIVIAIQIIEDPKTDRTVISYNDALAAYRSRAKK